MGKSQYLIFFNGDEDLSWVHKIQDKHEENKTLDSLVYICYNGTDDKYLHPDRFLVENKECSLENHFLWSGLFTEEEQKSYIYDKVREFFRTGEQLVIEHYEFTEDEPFYDYSR